MLIIEQNIQLGVANATSQKKIRQLKLKKTKDLKKLAPDKQTEIGYDKFVASYNIPC